MSSYIAAGGREALVGAISGAIFGPFGAPEALSGKMLLGGVTNGFESVIRQTLEGKGINFKTVLFDTGVGALTVGAFHNAGKLIKKASPFVKKAFNKVSTKISDNMKAAKIALKNMQRRLKTVTLGMNGGNADEALREFANKFKKAKRLVKPNSKKPMFGDDWNDYFSKKYGKENVDWVNKTKLEVNPFNESGKLKSNIKYKAGEYDYLYKTDDIGRIRKFETDNLQLTKRKDRLPHNSGTPGKVKGDHAGHLAGDRFGGSPELDNLVS